MLGVSESGTPAEIKRKYYDLAKRYHPDSTHEDSDRAIFVKVTRSHILILVKHWIEPFIRFSSFITFNKRIGVLCI